jgi:hypothetical protein
MNYEYYIYHQQCLRKIIKSAKNKRKYKNRSISIFKNKQENNLKNQLMMILHPPKMQI